MRYHSYRFPSDRLNLGPTELNKKKLSNKKKGSQYGPFHIQSTPNPNFNSVEEHPNFFEPITSGGMFLQFSFA